MSLRESSAAAAARCSCCTRCVTMPSTTYEVPCRQGQIFVQSDLVMPTFDTVTSGSEWHTLKKQGLSWQHNPVHL